MAPIVYISVRCWYVWQPLRVLTDLRSRFGNSNRGLAETAGNVDPKIARCCGLMLSLGAMTDPFTYDPTGTCSFSVAGWLWL